MPHGRVGHPRVAAFLRVFRNNNELPVRAPLLRLVRDSGKRTCRWVDTENLGTTSSMQSGKLFRLYKKSFVAETEEKLVNTYL